MRSKLSLASLVFALLTLTGCQACRDCIREMNDSLDMSISVNEDLCIPGPVYCDGGGHIQNAGASDNNHNPVSISILVTMNGKAVSGIPFSGFAFTHVLTPAGGPSITLCPHGGEGCGTADSFIDYGNGVYLMLSHPGPAGINWKSGQYIALLEVTNEATGAGGAELVEILIP